MENEIELQKKLLELNGCDVYYLSDYGVKEEFELYYNKLNNIPISVCSECGGINIETKVWADPNGNEVLEFAYINEQDNYCRDCNKHVKFKKIQIK